MKKTLIIISLALSIVSQGQTFSTLLKDRTKSFNVLDYGAKGDGVTDDTDAIQATINAAKDGTVLIPSGNYLVDSLLVTTNVTIEGAGWDWSTTNNNTRLVSTSALPVITIDYKINDGEGYATGAAIKNLYIKGDNSVDDGFHRQTGVCINGEAGVLLERVYIANMGDYGVRIKTTYHTDLVIIDKCRFDDNTKGGIYGRTSASAQINDIHISESSFTSNSGFGINLIGNNIIIERNTIQNNDSAGVYLCAADLGDVKCDSYNTVISGNYFEQNAGGNIVAKAFYGTVSQYHYHLTITDNYQYLDDATAIATVTASTIFKLASGSGDVKGFKYLIYGNNYISVDGSLYTVDAQNRLDNTCNIFFTNLSQEATNYTHGLSGASIYGRKTARPFLATGTVVAGTGITTAMLFDNMYFNTASPIDISANPQIADGYDGQEITIVGSSDTNTLTLDDGTGLALTGQCVLGVGDNIKLLYNATLDLWMEISRSNN